MELRIGRVGSQLTAHGSWLIAQSLSILSLPSIPFWLLPFAFRRYTAKHKRSIRDSRWATPELRIYGITDWRNYGTTDRASRLTAHSSQLTAHSSLYPFVRRSRSIATASEITWCNAEIPWCYRCKTGGEVQKHRIFYLKTSDLLPQKVSLFTQNYQIFLSKR